MNKNVVYLFDNRVIKLLSYVKGLEKEIFDYACEGKELSATKLLKFCEEMSIYEEDENGELIDVGFKENFVSVSEIKDYMYCSLVAFLITKEGKKASFADYISYLRNDEIIEDDIEMLNYIFKTKRQKLNIWDFVDEYYEGDDKPLKYYEVKYGDEVLFYDLDFDGNVFEKREVVGINVVENIDERRKKWDSECFDENGYLKISESELIKRYPDSPFFRLEKDENDILTEEFLKSIWTIGTAKLDTDDFLTNYDKNLEAVKKYLNYSKLYGLSLSVSSKVRKDFCKKAKEYSDSSIGTQKMIRDYLIKEGIENFMLVKGYTLYNKEDIEDLSSLVNKAVNIAKNNNNS